MADAIPPGAAPAPVSLAEAARVWAYVAAHSFGGPAGQIAVMHRVLVEERRWLGERRFLHALNYCMLLPGPEAQQLATYTGWLMHGARGGLLAGGLFVLPGFLSILALSVVYVLFQDVTGVAAALWGVKAAVLAVVVEAVLRIGKRVLHDRVRVGLAVAAFVAVFFFEVPFPVVVAGAAGVGLAGAHLGLASFRPGAGKDKADAGPPAVIDALLDAGLLPHVAASPGRALRTAAAWLAVWLLPVAALAALLGPDDVYTKLAVFFSKAAVVTFGGAYSVLAYVAQEAVDTHHWLRPGEMLDGLGLAETTPGPLIQVVQFVGFLAAARDPGALPPLVAGLLASVVVTWVTFAPCFLWVFTGAPYVERLRGEPRLAGALSAITSAVVGVVLQLGVWLALHVLFGTVVEVHAAGARLLLPDPATVDLAGVLVAVGAAVALLRYHVGMLPTLACAAAAGLVFSLAGLHG